MRQRRDIWSQRAQSDSHAQSRELRLKLIEKQSTTRIRRLGICIQRRDRTICVRAKRFITSIASMSNEVNYCAVNELKYAMSRIDTHHIIKTPAIRDEIFRDFFELFCRTFGSISAAKMKTHRLHSFGRHLFSCHGRECKSQMSKKFAASFPNDLKIG